MDLNRHKSSDWMVTCDVACALGLELDAYKSECSEKNLRDSGFVHDGVVGFKFTG